MKIMYLYWVEFKYNAPFENKENFVHGFYSTSKNSKYVMRTAERYHKKHRIPCKIVKVSEPELKLLLK